MNEIRGSRITVMKIDEKESRRSYKYGKDKMRLEDTTDRMNGRLLSGIRVLPLLGGIYVYTIVAENWTWQGGIRAE